MSKFFKTNAGVLSLVIIAICLIFTAINPQFFTLATAFSITRAGIVNSIVAISVLLIMITGGTDLSFMAIASFVSYSMTYYMTEAGIELPLVVILLIGMVFGAVLGALNACLVTWINLPTFIITLAMQNVLKGASYAFVGTKYISVVPLSMQKVSTSFLAVASTVDGKTSGLNATVLLVAAIYVFTFILMKYTMFGRKLYCLGADVVAAERIGINVLNTRIMSYGLAGALAGIAGLINISLLRTGQPGDLIGNEMLVIAAVIIGGASKGKGTVLGTLLGVLLITIINNSLTMLRVPSYWQKAVLGVIILVGTVLQFVKFYRKKRVGT